MEGSDKFTKVSCEATDFHSMFENLNFIFLVFYL